MDLKLYKQKRDFSSTPEPSGDEQLPGGEEALRFVIQKHKASHLHFDLRLEFDGVYKSWAVPKGPSLDPGARRLAVAVEEHPLAYGEFEGIIPAGNYGAGVVMIWDRGFYSCPGAASKAASLEAMRLGLEKGHLTFVLDGERLRGGFDLVYLKDKKNWLLLKKRDAHSSYKANPLESLETSVVSGRSFDEIASQAPAKNAVWISKRVGGGDLEPADSEQRDAPSWNPGKKNRKKTAADEAKATPASQASKPLAMRAVALRKPLQGQGWMLEPGLGQRLLLWKRDQALHLYSIRQLLMDRSYAALMASLRPHLPASMVVDGEVVGACFYAADLLYADGLDYRALPWDARQKKLAALVKSVGQPAFALLPHYESLEALRAAHPEVSEVTAKDPGSAYESKVAATWLRFSLEAAAEPLVRITHPRKIYWAAEQITKGDLIAYYRDVTEWILPHLRDRPLSLNRHPNGADGEGFYQKDFQDYHPDYLKTHPLYSKSSQRTINYALCQNKESLLYLANLGCIEFNPWFSTIHDLDCPNFLVIDLDPDQHEFSVVVQVALVVRQVLAEIGIAPYVKTSGSRGMHLGVALAPGQGFHEVAAFAEAICREVEARLPELTTTERTPARRKKKLYLDFLQNHRGQTLAAAYCVRPRPAATVSTPLAWEELVPSLRPEQFTLRTLSERLAHVSPDLWALAGGIRLDDYWPKLPNAKKP